MTKSNNEELLFVLGAIASMLAFQNGYKFVGIFFSIYSALSIYRAIKAESNNE